VPPCRANFFYNGPPRLDALPSKRMQGERERGISPFCTFDRLLRVDSGSGSFSFATTSEAIERPPYPRPATPCSSGSRVFFSPRQPLSPLLHERPPGRKDEFSPIPSIFLIASPTFWRYRRSIASLATPSDEDQGFEPARVSSPDAAGPLSSLGFIRLGEKFLLKRRRANVGKY